jgi:hypothetical protein
MICKESQGLLLDCECEGVCGNNVHLYCAQKEKLISI